MKFKSTLTEATFLRRYMRFLVEVSLKNRRKKMIYCPNLGPLLGCDVLGSRIWFSQPVKISRGALDVWELVEVDGGFLVSISDAHARLVVMEAVHGGKIPEFEGYRFLQAHGQANPLIEILINAQGEQCMMRIERVTLGDRRGDGFFPDAPHMGVRAIKELIALKQRNELRVVLFFAVQHNGIERVRIADALDPLYGQYLQQAVAHGIEVYAYRSNIQLESIELGDRIPILSSEDIML
jgi:sugar fermentation stimulation protein A